MFCFPYRLVPVGLVGPFGISSWCVRGDRWRALLVFLSGSHLKLHDSPVDIDRLTTFSHVPLSFSIGFSITFCARNGFCVHFVSSVDVRFSYVRFHIFPNHLFEFFVGACFIPFCNVLRNTCIKHFRFKVFQAASCENSPIYIYCHAAFF